ncbi:hypothetical protein ASG43_04105 [Aureimonas sp. Leaf454]|uniref:substrate-binding domain-containing protein n=1 Tax=Aureimonas sp. Leaf454 TaxID=1736381 RepID=UPI0006FE54B8|nr:substrate-binding domain-containing protein [Aureimonas sp. Leaf454]KQT54752.1 hypothetical protein ASG43_04105 [Aureimonas sp. Leaf454]
MWNGHRAVIRWLAVIGAAALLLTTPANAKTVGLLLSRSDDFMNLLRLSIEDHAGSLGEVDLAVEDAQGNADRQMDLLKGLIADRVDAVIVVAIDAEQGMPMSQLAGKAGIPLVFLNKEPIHVDELPEGQVYVGSNERESGTLQAAEVCRLLGGKGRIAVVMGELLHSAARARTRDIDEVVSGKDCSRIRIVERQSANGSRQQAQTLVAEWLEAGADFDAVIANNDEMALGAIEGLKAGAAWTDEMIVAGIDATKDGLVAVRDGDMQVTVLQNAEQQGEAALDAALALASGGIVPAKIFVPFELVTRANVDTYLAAR